MSQKGKKSKVKQKTTAKILLLVFLIFVLILLGFYMYFAFKYKDKFLENTTIAGYDVSGMTVSEAEAFFASKSSDYHIDVEFRDGVTRQIDSSDIDFQYNPDRGLQKAMQTQSPLTWPYVLFNGESFSLESSFSEKLLKSTMKSFPEMAKENMTNPEDAYIKWEDGDFVIEPEIMGTKFKTSDAIDAVSEAISKVETSVNLEDLYKNPKVYSDDEKLNAQLPILNKLIPCGITYQLPDGSTEVLDGSVMLDWLDTDSAGYVKDQEKWDQAITDYVTNMALRLDTVYATHKFNSNLDKVIEIRGTGYYGYKIDQEREIAALKEELETGEDVTRTPKYSMAEASTPDDNYGFGKTYIEVDLTRQHLWVYRDGEVEFETDVVSGKDTKERRTPDGAFMTYDKQKDKVLRGDVQPDGSYGYESHVNYWIRLTNSGVGLHDATWRHSFGGNIWITGGSHGCINLPINAAKTIYETVEERTPVIVYYS